MQGDREGMMRVGIGYDVHRLVGGRRLVLGGVEIHNDKGLLGHSDADVLIHAIADALLGAAALGDIGGHFPDTDPRFKDADSRALLRDVVRLVAEKGYETANVDAVIIAEYPRIGPYVSQMRENIASDLGVGISDVGIKATTNEGLGFVGRGEAIAAQAVVALLGRDI